MWHSKNFIIANDDDNITGNCENDAQLVATLTAGTTYYLVTTNFGSGLGNYEWTFTGPASATIATIQNSQIVNFTGLGSGTYTNFSINSGTCGTINFVGPVTITSPSAPITTGTVICPGGSGTISTSTVCGTPGTIINQGATFNSGTLATTDPVYPRAITGNTCTASGVGTSVYYDVYPFTVSATGSYTFNMCSAAFDGFGSIFQNVFNAATPCTNFVVGDDDANTAPCDNDARLIATLSTGITYFLVTSSFANGNTGTYDWTFSSGPAGSTITSSATGGVLQWYTAATGGSSISSANPFNPVGVGGSGIVNTNTAGTFTFYAACSTNPVCRTATTFTIGSKTWTGTTSADWSVNTNWNNNIIPNASDCVNIPVTVNSPVISGTNYNALAGTLTIQNGATLTVNASNSITVTDIVTVVTGGTFNIKNNASLVQVNNVTNSGNINMERIANLKLLDYCYWSAPVGNLAAGTFPITSVSPSTPASLIFRWDTTATNPNGGQGYWLNTTENMIPGKGYIVRAPTTLGFLAATPTPFTANFIGRPNNGIITFPISRGTDFTTVGLQGLPRTAADDNWNLIGNPYPSAIGVKEFVSLLANNNIVGGVKIWTHASQPTSAVDPFYQNFATNYFASDYNTINVAGAVSGPGDYKIGSGQGFMVAMVAGTPGTATVTFNNSMRSASFANNQFYRNTNIVNAIEQNRIWLDLTSPTGQSSRTLIGYVTGATNDDDRLYDMFTSNKSSQNFYSLISQNPMLIQGKALPFDVNDVVDMGIKIPENGIFTIGIATVDGLFQNGNQTIYLQDRQLQRIHNLSVAPYSFTAQQGISNDRFAIRYTDNALNTKNENFQNLVSIFVNNGINIQSVGKNIKDVMIYDVLGKTLYNKVDANVNNFTLTDILPTNSMLFVKIKLSDNKVIIKKIIY